MKTITLFFIVFAISINHSIAQSTKIVVSEDAYVQGGETADENLGKTAIKKLMVGNSKANNKYARKTFLKFELPSNLNNLNSIVLNIPIKVFKSDVNPEAKFKLDVFIVTNNNWKEDKITWNNAEESDSKAGSIEIDQSQDDKNEWVQIELDASLINELLQVQKGNIITLALLNIDFNKTTAILPSKENSKKTASYLTVN